MMTMIRRYQYRGQRRSPAGFFKEVMSGIRWYAQILIESNLEHMSAYFGYVDAA